VVPTNHPERRRLRLRRRRLGAGSCCGARGLQGPGGVGPAGGRGQALGLCAARVDAAAPPLAARGLDCVGCHVWVVRTKVWR
jgi:hypothetical protein